MFKIQNKTYKNLTEICRDKEVNIYNISITALKYRLNKKKMSLEEALNTPPIRQAKKVIINNKVYKSINQTIEDYIANKYNLNRNTIYYRIKNGLSLEEALSVKRYYRSKKQNKNIIINGKSYPDITTACQDKDLNIYNLDRRLIYSRIKKGMSLEEAFSIPKMKQTKSEIIFNGKIYRSIRELCKDKTINIHNLSVHTIYTRLRKNMPLEIALRLPTK